MAGFKLMYSQYETVAAQRAFRNSTEGKQQAQCSQRSETRQLCKYGYLTSKLFRNVFKSNQEEQYQQNKTNKTKNIPVTAKLIIAGCSWLWQAGWETIVRF